MSPYQYLAAHLVSEIPIARLQRLVETPPSLSDEFTVGGGLCGNNCEGAHGTLCGVRCRPTPRARDVIDRDGELAPTVGDLETIRQNLPQLRKAVADELAPHLDRLKRLC